MTHSVFEHQYNIDDVVEVKYHKKPMKIIKLLFNDDDGFDYVIVSISDEKDVWYCYEDEIKGKTYV